MEFLAYHRDRAGSGDLRAGPDDNFRGIQPDGSGGIQQFRRGQAQARMPDRRIDQKHQFQADKFHTSHTGASRRLGPGHVSQPRMRGQ